MPWKVSSPMDERVSFISRAKAGESITELCKEFGISWKTAYKFLKRYDQRGPAGLHDLSRRPLSCPNETSLQARQLIVRTRKEKPTWGAAKIRDYLIRRHAGLKVPSRFTVHEILNRYDLVQNRGGGYRSKSPSAFRAPDKLGQSQAPNEIWCADFKGQFQMGSGKYCYPLTITDHFSRYLLCCEGMQGVHTPTAKEGFELAFQEYGLPQAIRSDNGVPFASGGLFGLSQLSVWWLRLGIKLQRIEPGHPEQNGRHERMHLTLKMETTRPAAANFLQQQEKFDQFRECYNSERPHEGLKMKVPNDLYRKSGRPYPGTELPEPEYPLHDLVKKVGCNGTVKIGAMKDIGVHLGTALAGQPVGLTEEDPGLWRISFMSYDLGLADLAEKKFKPFQTLRPSGLGA